jgi:hypothetical protein
LYFRFFKLIRLSNCDRYPIYASDCSTIGLSGFFE